MQAVEVQLYSTERSYRLVDSAYTLADGTARFRAEENKSYLVTFVGNWGGAAIIPPDYQNAGASTAGQQGGFMIHLTPQEEYYLFTFVFVMNTEGFLVPLFDLSRSAQSEPEPFTYENIASDEVYIIPEEERAPLIMTPLLEAVGVEGQGEQDDDNLQQPVQELVTSQEESSEAETDSGLIGLIMVTIIVGTVVLVLWIMIIVQTRRSRGARHV